MLFNLQNLELSYLVWNYSSLAPRKAQQYGEFSGRVQQDATCLSIPNTISILRDNFHKWHLVSKA